MISLQSVCVWQRDHDGKKDIVISLENPADLNVQCKWMRTSTKASHLMQVSELVSLDKIYTYVYNSEKNVDVKIEHASRHLSSPVGGMVIYGRDL